MLPLCLLGLRVSDALFVTPPWLGLTSPSAEPTYTAHPQVTQGAKPKFRSPWLVRKSSQGHPGLSRSFRDHSIFSISYQDIQRTEEKEDGAAYSKCPLISDIHTRGAEVTAVSGVISPPFEQGLRSVLGEEQGRI